MDTGSINRALIAEAQAIDLSEADATLDRSRGVRSVEIGVQILHELARNGRPMSLRDLSAAVDMSPAKVHRYLVSFVTTGMVNHRRNGSYDLGRLSGEIGLEAVKRNDLVNQAADILPELVEVANATGFVAIWSAHGPIVVRWERARSNAVMLFGVGASLPIAASAAGRAFVSHLPDRVVQDTMSAVEPHDVAQLDKIRAIENDGTIFRCSGSYVPNLFSIAHPILDFGGYAVAVVALMSKDRSLVVEGGAAEKAMRDMLKPVVG